MKIALLVPSWPPGFSPNGIVTYASHLVPALRCLGHEVFIITKNRAGGEDPYTIDLRRFAVRRTVWERAKGRLFPDSMRSREVTHGLLCAIKELIGTGGIDVFEMEESFGWSFAISQLGILPVVVRLHGPWFLTGCFGNNGNIGTQNAGRVEREGTGLRSAHMITGPSTRLLEAVRQRYNLGLEFSSFVANPVKTASSGERWNLEACDRDTILFVGRFDSLKGGDFVLRAFAHLAQVCPSARLTFVGPDNGVHGPEGSIISFEEFVRCNVPEQSRSRIDFRGQQSHSDVESLRRTHFVTIVASQYENSPYSVLEPMSFGCPIIATAVGGIPELIDDRRNGLLVPSQDVRALSDACQELFENHFFAARLGQQAWYDCKSFYDPQIIAKQTITAYQSAIDAFNSHAHR